MSEVSYRDELAAHYKAVRGRLDPPRVAPVRIQFHNTPVGEKTEEQIRKDLMRSQRDILYISTPHRLMGKHVVDCVVKHYNVTMKELRGNKRNKLIIIVRHVISYLTRDMCPHLSYPEIGRFINKDHTCVINGYRKVKAALERGEDWVSDVPILRGKLEDLEPAEFV